MSERIERAYSRLLKRWGRAADFHLRMIFAWGVMVGAWPPEPEKEKR